MVLQTGEIVDNRYRVVKLLGQGGMGAVYKAWDVRLNHPIALKEMIPQPGLDAEFLAQLRQQFESEAQVLATLSHVNLVRVTDYFVWSENQYLVMDFVEGEDLATRISRDGPQDEGLLYTWALQLLDGLAYCHKKGVLHRDIKPQNIIITPENRAVLVDFGLVKLWDPNDPHTRTVMRGAGTPEYAPPEQYDLGTGHTDPRSDVYSLGATLYHAITGKIPPTATQRMANPASFVSPRQVKSQLSPVLDQAILRAMSVAMRDRFQSAEAMKEALTKAAVPQGGTVVVGPRPAAGATLPTAARPATQPPVTPRPVTRPPTTPPAVVAADPHTRKLRGGWWLIVAGAVIACVVVAGLGWMIAGGLGWGGDKPPDVTLAPPTTSQLSTEEPTTAPPPASTLAARPNGGVVFEDNFDQQAPEPVPLYGQSYMTFGYQNGEGVLTSIYENGVLPAMYPLNDLPQDFFMEFDFRAPSAQRGYGYGLIFRGQGSDPAHLGDYYMVLFRPADGVAGLSCWQNGSWVLTENYELPQGVLSLARANHVRLEAIDNQFRVFLNDVFIFQVEDARLTGPGMLGLAVSPGVGSGQVSAYFDNLVVYEPGAVSDAGLRDDFSDPKSGWSVIRGQGGYAIYQNGALHILNYTDADAASYSNRGVWYSDVIMEVQSQLVDGSANNWQIHYCRVSEHNFYAALFSADGYYTVYLLNNGSGNNLIDIQSSDVINQGVGAVNVARVECVGNHIRLSVNGALLADVTDDTLTEGDIGLGVISLDGDYSEVAFDNLVVTTP